jgi:hypothetical protein
MSTAEIFANRVNRIAEDHNISEREAVRVALIMERVEKRKTEAGK